MITEKIRAGLMARQDLQYRQFHSRLMPTVEKERVIGVRVPQLRAYAKQLKNEPELSEFLADLPHTYYEENCLHGFLIEQIKDYPTCMAETERFLPYVDNWAVCDLFAPKVFRKHPEEVLEKCRTWVQSGETYTVRYGLVTLLRQFLDEQFTPEILELAVISSEDYYVNMAAAWLFAEALVKQYDAVLPYLQEHRLTLWTHNKAIQKAVESRRIAPETKAYLKTLKRT